MLLTIEGFVACANYFEQEITEFTETSRQESLILSLLPPVHVFLFLQSCREKKQVCVFPKVQPTNKERQHGTQAVYQDGIGGSGAAP